MRSVMAAGAVLALCGAAAAQETKSDDGLKWGTLEEAKKARKPIAYLRILGEIDGKL
jgi:hypothetical protein